MSKLLDVVAAGEEISISRRGVEVAKLIPSVARENPMDREIDWAAWAHGQRRFLKAMPRVEGSAMDADREDCRW